MGGTSSTVKEIELKTKTCEPWRDADGYLITCLTPDDFNRLPILTFESIGDAINTFIQRVCELKLIRDPLWKISTYNKFETIELELLKLRTMVDNNTGSFETQYTTTMLVLCGYIDYLYPVCVGIKIKYRGTFDGERSLHLYSDIYSDMKYIDVDGTTRDANFFVVPSDISITIKAPLPRAIYSRIIPEKGDIEGYCTMLSRKSGNQINYFIQGQFRYDTYKYWCNAISPN
jgi:hypothetical protein